MAPDMPSDFDLDMALDFPRPRRTLSTIAARHLPLDSRLVYAPRIDCPPHDILR